MKITCPWPPKELSTNARVHWAVISRKKIGYKQGCKWAALEAGARPINGIGVLILKVKITFCPPDKRRRDRDNMIGAFKAGQDAVAQIIGVDDQYWVPTYEIGPVRKQGAVQVEFDYVAR